MSMMTPPCVRCPASLSVYCVWFLSLHLHARMYIVITLYLHQLIYTNLKMKNLNLPANINSCNLIRPPTMSLSGAVPVSPVGPRYWTSPCFPTYLAVSGGKRPLPEQQQNRNHPRKSPIPAQFESVFFLLRRGVVGVPLFHAAAMDVTFITIHGKLYPPC
jgi:hypothetical protein